MRMRRLSTVSELNINETVPVVRYSEVSLDLRGKRAWYVKRESPGTRETRYTPAVLLCTVGKPDNKK
jgi:hypothetical protein